MTPMLTQSVITLKDLFECTCKPGYSGNGDNCTDDYISVETWIVLLRLYHLPRVHAFESVESKKDIFKCTNTSLKSSLIDKVIVVIISIYYE